MSGSMAPSPPVTDGRLGLCLRLGLVIAVGLIWTHGPTHGLAGTPDPGDGGVRCPICRSPGGERGDGKYSCTKRHVFTEAEAEAAKAAAVQADTAEAEVAPAVAAPAEATKSEG
jgi:hypothetical protein